MGLEGTAYCLWRRARGDERVRSTGPLMTYRPTRGVRTMRDPYTPNTACSDCHARPGWHKLWCPRTQRIATAMVHRLREQEVSKP